MYPLIEVLCYIFVLIDTDDTYLSRNKAASMVVDLHSHTTYSDGELAVSELLEHARNHGVEVFSITDHDCIEAYRDIESDVGMRIIPGVEISCQLDGKELHLVGLGIDLANPQLNQLINNNQMLRKERAEWIVARLQKLKYPDISQSLDQQVTGDVICRTHLAKALVSEGLARDFQTAFKRFIGRSGKAWKRAGWPAMTEVIDVVHAAGGFVILAHPTKYRYSSGKLTLIIEEFARDGGDAIEINYSGLNLNHKTWLKRLARNNGLMVSVGSDFHHLGQTWAVPGKFSQIDSELTPVWSQFQL